MSCSVLHCISLLFTVSCAFQCLTLAYSLFHCLSLAYSLFHCLSLSLTVLKGLYILHCLTLPYTVLQYISLHQYKAAQM